MSGRPLLSLAALATLMAAGGASCPKNMRSLPPPAPIVFRQSPTLPEVIQVVNASSNRIQQLQATGATLTVPGMPALRASLALDRPARFRLRAETGLTGAELDLGSNDEVFWMWVKRQQPPTVYYGRHQQFTQSAARQILPVPPHWIIDALGVIYLDPDLPHDGPHAMHAGRLEIRTPVASPEGQLTRITVIDDTYGWVLELHLYDAQGRRLASSLMSQHRYDPAHGVALPRHVDIYLPPAQLSFSIQTEGYAINQLYSNPLQLWSMPRLNGHQYVDLADPRVHVPANRDPGPATAAGEWRGRYTPLESEPQMRRLPALPGRG